MSSDRRTTIFFRTKCLTCSVTGSMIYIFWACTITRNKPIKYPVLNRHMTCMKFQLKYVEGAVTGKSLKRQTILSEDEQNQRKKKYEENRPNRKFNKNRKKVERVAPVRWIHECDDMQNLHWSLRKQCKCVVLPENKSLMKKLAILFNLSQHFHMNNLTK